MIRDLTVLVIEDNPAVMREIIDSLHSDRRIECFPATSLRAGLAALEATRYDALVLDLDLPDAEELDALKVIRHLHPEVPVVILTGYGAAEFETEALRIGAQDFLEKRFVVREALTAAVRKAVIRQEVEERFAVLDRSRATTDQEIERYNRLSRRLGADGTEAVERGS